MITNKAVHLTTFIYVKLSKRLIKDYLYYQLSADSTGYAGIELEIWISLNYYSINLIIYLTFDITR